MKKLTIILALLPLLFSLEGCKSKKKKKEYKEEIRQQNLEIKKLNLDRNNLPKDINKKVNSILNNAEKRRSERLKNLN
jgi:PBP1b-binding outer membrane lipoprotein LpoB